MKTTRTTKTAVGMLSAAFLLWGAGGVAAAAQGSGRGLRSPAQIEAELEAQRELEVEQQLEIERELELEQELEQEVEQQSVDSDGDGLPDEVEIERGLDPNDADTDHDGIVDGVDPDPFHPEVHGGGRGR